MSRNTGCLLQAPAGKKPGTELYATSVGAQSVCQSVRQALTCSRRTTRVSRHQHWRDGGSLLLQRLKNSRTPNKKKHEVQGRCLSGDIAVLIKLAIEKRIGGGPSWLYGRITQGLQTDHDDFEFCRCCSKST
jgi:hypothetical protein